MYRWVNGPECSNEEWDKLDLILATRGWMSLSRLTSRILIAENAEGDMLGFSVIQFVPFSGPLWVAPSARGTGIADELAEKTVNCLLVDMNARGFMATAESPHTAKLCLKQGMTEIPVKVFSRGGGA